MIGKKVRKDQIKILSILAVAIVTISIGFAAYSSILKINTTAQVTPDSSTFGVIFSSDGTNESTTQTINPNSSTYGDDATITNGATPTISGLNAKFTSPGQSVSYSFYAKNTGSYLAYLNYITYLGSKICTASDGTSQELVDDACNGISVSVKVGNNQAVTGSTSLISNHTLASGNNEQVVVTISYASNSARADGPFNVNFGDISLTYSTISDYTVQLITFSISDKQYQAEEGMTWSQWMESNYNTDNYNSSYILNMVGPSAHVNLSDTIQSGFNYSYSPGGSGD